jgi:tetratricopeptide (TPR) repeat protein
MAMIGELRHFRRKRLSPDEGRAAAERYFSAPIEDRHVRAAEYSINDPETLLPLLDFLRDVGTSNPRDVLEESRFLYDFLFALHPKYPVDAFLLDEREYFLGEVARIAGTMSRELALRDEARRWLDLADAWFLQTENSSGNIAKVGYQRLALRVEERDFSGVQELLPRLVATFRKLGMSEDALKARFLEAMVLKEVGNVASAKDLLHEILSEAKSCRNTSLTAYAYINLVQTHGLLGEAHEAVELANEAAPLLRSLDNRVGLAKLYWGIGYLNRSASNVPGAVEAYRVAQQEFSELGMRADVAAVHLVIADLLLDSGQDRQAEWEVRQALPIIDEYKLVPEGFAALSLLRESLRRQKIDRQALRNLHGYFEELSS